MNMSRGCFRLNLKMVWGKIWPFLGHFWRNLRLFEDFEGSFRGDFWEGISAILTGLPLLYSTSQGAPTVPSFQAFSTRILLARTLSTPPSPPLCSVTRKALSTACTGPLFPIRPLYYFASGRIFKFFWLGVEGSDFYGVHLVICGAFY